MTDFFCRCIFLQCYSETYTCIGAIGFADFELIALIGTKPNTYSFGDKFLYGAFQIEYNKI